MPLGSVQYRLSTEDYNQRKQVKNCGEKKSIPKPPNIRVPVGCTKILDELMEIKASPQRIGSRNGKNALSTTLCSLLLLQQICPVESFANVIAGAVSAANSPLRNAVSPGLKTSAARSTFTGTHPDYPLAHQRHHSQPEFVVRAWRGTNQPNIVGQGSEYSEHLINKRDVANQGVASDAGNGNVDTINQVRHLAHESGVTQIVMKNENLLEQRKAVIENFYQDYDGYFLSLGALAKYVMNERIREKFGVDINPDKTYFVKFSSAMSCSDSYTGWCHDETPFSNHTLTDYLFTNFSAQEREHQVDLNSVAGVYNASQSATDEFGAKNQVRILPDKFLDLVRDINFSDIAEKTYRKIYARKDLHVKKKFMDFFLDLATAKPGNDIVNDLLAGAGLTKTNGVFVSHFDINGCKAANMFVFTNPHSLKVTLYMPNHPKRFIDFVNLGDMRSWIIRNSAHQENRQVIASHFSLKNRHDGPIHDGIDSWLNRFSHEAHAEEHVNDICKYSAHIPFGTFFATMVDNESQRFFDDLDSSIESNAEVIRDMVEMDLDASNILPNPITPFLSFAFHLEHYFDSDTELERRAELSKIKSDVMNFALMVMTDRVININAEGYAFIDNVKNDLAAGFDEQLIEKFRDVKMMSYTDAINKFSVPTSEAGNHIRVTPQVLDCVKELSVLNPSDFSEIEPTEHGICKMTHVRTREKTMAITIFGKIYQLKPGSFGGAFVLDNGEEIVLLDDVYHLRNIHSEDVVKYTPCRAKRSPDNNCVYFSQQLNDVLFKNVQNSESIQEIGAVRQHEKYPSLTINNAGKSYIKFHDFFFKVDKKGSSFVVYAKKGSGLLNKLTGRKTIAKFEFSTKNGMMYLNSPAENIVETLGLSEAQARAVYFPVEMGDQFVALTEEEKEIMRAYGATGYDAINGFLEQNMQTGLYPESYENAFIHCISTIRAVLKKLPRFEGVVYRGGMIDSDVRQTMHVGDLISHKKFLSCSTDESVARNFKLQHDNAGVIYKINLQTSGHAVSK